MRTTVRKWGNSLAIRIPRTLAADLGLEDAAQVDLRVVDGSLIASPARRWVLDDLVRAIDENNAHEEVDWGGSVGRELL